MTLAQQLIAGLSPAGYLDELGFKVHEWQRLVLRPDLNRICMLCARQAGKSTVVAGYALWKAKHFPGSFILIVAPSEKQAQDTMGKIKELLALDPDLDDLVADSKSEVVTKDGSRILSVPWTSARGKSKPDVVILDEASRIPDMAYIAIRPTLTANPNAVMFLLSTPNGKQGFFHRAWISESNVWTKIQVQTAFELETTISGITVVPRKMSEKVFKKKMEKKGIHGFYSPQHTREWLEEELDEIGEWGWRQEYGIEFVDTMDQVFNTDDILRMFRSDLEHFTRREAGLGKADAPLFERAG